jgi:hypothetical protein
MEHLAGPTTGHAVEKHRAPFQHDRKKFNASDDEP